MYFGVKRKCPSPCLLGVCSLFGKKGTYENVGRNAKQLTTGASNRGKTLGVEEKDLSAGHRRHMVTHVCLRDREFSSLAEESLRKHRRSAEITVVVMAIMMISCIINIEAPGSANTQGV